MEIWPTVHSERKALASDLAALSDQQWSVPSLCTDWTVRDVVAHMTATAKTTPPAFFGKVLASGFSFTGMQSKDIARERGASAADTLAGHLSRERDLAEVIQRRALERGEGISAAVGGDQAPDGDGRGVLGHGPWGGGRQDYEGDTPDEVPATRAAAATRSRHDDVPLRRG